MVQDQETQMINDLKALGVQRGTLLMVHSSLSALGKVEGGAQTVIDALKKAVGSAGTLLMPALTYENVTRAQPIFDLRRTPVCVGTIPECFRKEKDTFRSMHPTHSICASGPAARALTAGHVKDRTPVGANSPLRLLAQRGGKILMLGCGLEPDTSMHGVEELVRPPYLFEKTPTVYTLIGEDGNEREAAYTAHDFAHTEQRYDRVEQLLNAEELQHGKVLQAECWLIDAAALWKKAEQKLREDPLWFVDITAEE
jgi:aminoglycoside 3-N-acetyltransferase